MARNRYIKYWQDKYYQIEIQKTKLFYENEKLKLQVAELEKLIEKLRYDMRCNT